MWFQHVLDTFSLCSQVLAIHINLMCAECVLNKCRMLFQLTSSINVDSEWLACEKNLPDPPPPLHAVFHCALSALNAACGVLAQKQDVKLRHLLTTPVLEYLIQPSRRIYIYRN